MEVAAKRQAAQQLTQSYRDALGEAHRWLDSVVKRVEALEKGGDGPQGCALKMHAVQELAVELDSQGNARVEEVKKLVDQVVDAVSNLGTIVFRVLYRKN